MKKRLLSMLLLVAMVVTALPLVALPAVATENEEKEYVEDYYNSLYVQDGLVYAVDFFHTNEYWKGAAVEYAYTQSADYKAAASAAAWLPNASITWGDLTKGSVKIENGYLAYIGANDLSLRGIAKETGFAYNLISKAPAAASADLLIKSTGGTVMFNNVRTTFKAGALDNVNVQNTDYYSLKSPTVDGAAVKTSIYNRPANLTISIALPKLTESLAWGATTLKDGSSLGTYKQVTNNVTTVKSYTASAKKDAYAGEYIEVDGETVLSIAASSTKLSPFFQPSMITVPVVEYQAGQKLGTPLENVLVFFPETQSVTGTYKLYEDGTETYANEATPYLNNTYSYDACNLQWSTNCVAQYYALRYYKRTITEAEAAQNHLADLAKWFRLDLSGLLQLNEAELAEVAEVAKAYNITSDREAVASAIDEKTDEVLLRIYTGKYEGKVDDAIFAVAKDYLLDLDPIIGMPRGLLSNTYTFLLGNLEGVDVEAGYAAALELDLVGYAAAGGFSKNDYNTLYVQDDALLLADFFSYNSYWGETYTMPTPPTHQTAFEYNGATYNLTDEDVCLDWIVKYTLNSATETLGTYDKKAEAEAAVATKKAESEAFASATYTIYPLSTPAFAGNSKSAKEVYVAELMSFLKSNVFLKSSDYTIEMRVELPRVDDGQWSERNTKNQFACFTVGDGFLQMTSQYGSSNYLNASSIPNHKKEPIVSGQMVMAVGAKLGSTGRLMLLHDAAFTGTATATDITFTGMADYGNGIKGVNWAKPAKLPIGQYDSFTLTMLNHLASDGVSYDVAGYANGTEILPFTNFKDSNTASAGSCLYYGTNIDSEIYAYRFYSRDLTVDEMARNHFADVAKFFRLNITGYDMLSAEDQKAVWAAVADINLGSSTRIEAQVAFSRALAALNAKTYEALKVEGNDAFNAFLDVAHDYQLDLADVLGATRDVSSVYTAVTADTLAGKSVAAAQAILDEAIYDAHHYLSYAMGDEAFDGFLGQLAESDAHLNVESLMALPKEVRKTAATLALTQEAIDAFVEEKMAAYASYGRMTAEDYNRLYVQDDLFFSMDFFSTNEHWNNASVDLNTTNKDGDTYLYTGTNAAIASFVNHVEGTFTFGRNGLVQGVAENGALRLTNSSDKIWLNMTFSKGQMTTTDYDYTVENVFRHGATNGVNQFYHRQNWFQIATSNPGTENAAITFQQMYSQFGTYGESGGELGIFSFWNILHSFSPKPKVTVGNGANTFSFVYRLGEYLESATSPVTGSVPAVELYMPGMTDPAFSVSSLKSSLLKTNPDCVKSDGSYDTATDPGHYGVDPASIRDNWTDRIGYGGFDGYTYAVRYYSRALSQDETLQNHFADLVKFFRIDASGLAALSDADKLPVYRALRNFEVATSTREEVAAAYYVALNGAFAAEYAALPAEMTAILEKAPFDASALLAIREENARAAIAAKLTAEYSADYALSSPVLAAELSEAMAFLSSIDFLGVQVRLATNNPADEMPGVRSLFTIDRDVLKDLLLAAKETGEEVVLGATVEMNGNPHTIYFYPVLGDDGEVTFREDGAKLQEFEIEGKEVFGFAYTVTYKNYEGYSAEQAYMLYNAEYAYSFFVTVGEITYTRDVAYSQFEDGTVSAYKAYKYFADQGKYLGNAMMKEVLQKGAPLAD